MGCMVSLPLFVWLAGDAGWGIWIVLFIGLAGWATWRARRHDAKQSKTPLREGQTPTPVEILRQILTDEKQSWVLFRHGTFVVVTEPGATVAEEATALLRQYGPVTAGSGAGDFGAYQLIKFPGWVVTSHRPEIITYVSSGELAGQPETDLSVGLVGRQKRHLDASELEIVHVEDKGRRGRSFCNPSAC